MTPSTQKDELISSDTYKTYLDNLLAGNRTTCSQIATDLIENGVDFPVVYENLFKATLYEIGVLWELNRISVAAEHMATAITEGIMNQLYPNIINPVRAQKKGVIASVENETHQVGGKMAADILEKQGWDAIYLGASTPLGELLNFIAATNPNLVGLSLSVYFNFAALKQMLDEISIRCKGLDIIIGGQALQSSGADLADSYANATYIASLEELESYLDAYQKS